MISATIGQANASTTVPIVVIYGLPFERLLLHANAAFSVWANSSRNSHDILFSGDAVGQFDDITH